MDHERLLVEPGVAIRLRDYDPGFTGRFDDKDDAKSKLAKDVETLAALQEIFAAARSRSMLIVLQGMDTSGKDGAIKHVMSGVNPQGVEVHGFKEPSPEELAHDYLWRYRRLMPGRGRIGIFNRSYYEEVLVVRVHPELLANETPAATSQGDDIWNERYEDINALERHLTRSGTEIVKFFLHISKEEQRKRLLARLDDPDKHWKFSLDDVRERRFWDEYQTAYELMLNATSTKWAPWYIIPSDHKWFMRTAIADVIVSRLEDLHLRYPLDAQQRSMLAQVRAQLEKG